MKYVFWEDNGLWLGYLAEYPDYMTQGESLDELKENLKDLPDHIAHEFEFMGILANQESQATGGEKIGLEEMQMNFFSRFIQPWVPSFCERIEQQSRIPFYRNLAILTQKFIDFEKYYLGIPEELTPRKEIVSERR